MSDVTNRQHGGRLITEIANAMVALHKEQFGRGPTGARVHFAGPDMLVCVMDAALLPAELALVDMGEQHRVRESRLFMQVASAEHFTTTIEGIVGRKVRSFVSACDPDQALVMEFFIFEA